MIPKLYTRLITADDFKDNFGYDLKLRLNQGNFNTIEDAVNSWLDEACESINQLIMQRRGREFTTKLNLFIAEDVNSTDELYQAMYWAQLYEARFFFENGRPASLSKVDGTIKHHDEQALQILYTYGILEHGVM